MFPVIIVGKVPVYAMETPDGGPTAFCFVSGMEIDADGARYAYAPHGSGLPALDYEGNAHRDPQDLSSPFVGVVTANGKPVIRPDGFFVSTTALVDPSKALDDPARYVDSAEVEYVVLPPELIQAGARLGDLCYVLNRQTGKCSPAIAGDIGPHHKAGEGSIALAKALGVPSSPKNGGTDHGIVYAVFKGTANGWPRPTWKADAEERLTAFGGMRRLVGAAL